MKRITKNLLKLKGKRTLRQFAESLKMKQSTLHNYLHGRRLPEDVIANICITYGISADWLLGIKELPEPSITSQALLFEIKASIKELNDIINRYDEKE